jgi:hypothetical protein
MVRERSPLRALGFGTIVDRLLVVTAQDGSSLVLGEEPGDRRRGALFFEHVGRGEPRPVVGRLCAFSVIVAGQRQVVFAGTAPSTSSAAAVHLQFPDRSRTCRVQTFRHRHGVWMSFPEPFCDGQTVKALWIAENRVHHEETSAPLAWELPERPVVQQDSVRPGAAEETVDGFTVTRYAYLDTGDD